MVENTISLLCPYVAYIPADEAHCSGVLAVVAMGLYLGRAGPRVITAATRLQAVAMWEMLTFLLEGFIFILIGLELPEVVGGLKTADAEHLTVISLIVAGVMVITRMAFIFPGAYLPRIIDKFLRGRAVNWPPWRNILFGGWAGIRGGDSLVIALALPYTLAGGEPLAGRNAIIFITFGVILATLVVQGLTLVPLIRVLGLKGDDEEEREERAARRASIEAAARAIERYGSDKPTDVAGLDELKSSHARELERVRRSPDRPPEDLELRFAVISAQREAIIAMRDRNEINDVVMRKLQAELDHEEVLLQRRFG